MNADGDDFDALLGHELRRHVGRLQGPTPAYRQAAYRAVSTGGRTSMSLVPSLAAATSSKIAAGLATAALVVGGGSAAASAATHSTDPGVWGRTVTQAVATCKSQLAAGEHGIGQCVSAVAKEHGEDQRAAHAQSGGGSGASPNSQGNANGSANGKSHDAGDQADADHAQGKPTAAPGSLHGTPPANGHSNNSRHP
jgi:hypothetical protein